LVGHSRLSGSAANEIVALCLLALLFVAFFHITVQPVFAQTIILSPTNGVVGTSVTVTGSSFASNSQIMVYYDGLPVGNGTTSSTGAFKVIFAVPSSIRGAHTVRASDGVNSITSPFTVTSSLSRSPTSGSVGTNITLTGYGFSPSAIVTIKWDGTLLPTSPSSVLTDSNGAFVAIISAPPGEPVSHTIEATEGSNVASATFTIARSVILSPGSGSAGTNVFATGSGFLASSVIAITFDGSPILTSPVTVVSDGNGYFIANFTVPVSSPGGKTVRAVDNIGGSAQATFTVVPSISLSPSTGQGGTTITVTGIGFAPSGTVAIRINGTAVFNVRTDISGGFSQVFTLPPTPASVSILSAMDVVGASANATFSVVPLVSASPSSGPVMAVLTITGVGFTANAMVTLFFDGSPVATNPPSVTTDPFGNFICFLNVPSISVGAWSILAVDSDGFWDTVTFTIVRSLSLSLATGPVGTSVIARGTGFAPNAQINLTFDDLALLTNPSPILTDFSGRFNCSFSVPVSLQGRHSIVATDPLGSLATIAYTTTPSIALVPISGNGSVVTVNGNGFGPVSLVMLSFDGYPVASTPAIIETDFLGSFLATFTAESNTTGAHTVRATDLLGNTATSTLTLVPQITLSSTSGAVLVSVTITGTGFYPLNQINLTWDDRPINATPSPLVTNVNGGFRAVVTIPLDVAGIHAIMARDLSGNRTSANYTVISSIALIPSGLLPGDELWVRGIGFSKFSQMMIIWDEVPTVTRPAVITTDSLGSFQASFIIPFSIFGSHRVVAVDQQSNSSSSAYTISPPSTIGVQIDVGYPYKIEGATEFYVLITQIGKPSNASTISARLFMPNGTVIDLSGNLVRIDAGFYRINYTVPDNATLGTYAIIVNASCTFNDISSFGYGLGTFDVGKPQAYPPSVGAFVLSMDKYDLIFPSLSLILASLLAVSLYLLIRRRP